MSEPAVSSLGYLELGVTDPGAWKQYATETLGVAVVEAGESLLIRYDEAAWRIRVLPTGEDDLRCAGFSVTDAAALDAIATRLEAGGARIIEGTGVECHERQVDQLLKTEDPFGLAIELYVGNRDVDTPFVSPLGVSEFVTGEMGLGHIVLFVADEARAVDFYQGGLGFKLSDHILMGQGDRQLRLTFLHCNPRHHTLALAPVPVPKKLNHIMLQVGTLDDVGCGLDRAMQQGVPISSSIGRHTNDLMTSFYMQTPSGFDIEYGFGGVEVDDETWQTTTYHAPSLWGHKGNLN